MLRSAFEKMTGIYPSENLFDVIEEAYQKSMLSEREFCFQYRSNIGRLAEKIQCEANRRACQTAYLYGTTLGEIKLENIKLKKGKILDEVKKLKGSDVAYIYAESEDGKDPKISMYGNGTIILACVGRIIEVCAVQAKKSPAEILKAFTEIYGK